MFRRPKPAFLVATLLSTIVTAATIAAVDGDSWVDKKIMTKKAGIKISHTDDQDRQVDLATLNDIGPYTVLKEQGPWIMVRKRGIKGWLLKQNAVLLEDALVYFTQQIGINPKDDNAWCKRGLAREEKGEFENAVKDLTEAIRLRPEIPHCYTLRGNVYGSKKEYDRAIADYNEAIRIDPKFAFAYYNRGLAFSNKKDYDRAIADYNEAISIDPKFAFAYTYRGVAYSNKKDYDRAIADYNEAIRIEPNYATAFNRRGLVFKKRKEYDRSIADFNEAIRLEPNHHAAYNNRAWLWATCPDAKYCDGKKAVESARRACELSEWKEPYCIDTLAEAYAETGDFQQATKWQKKALEFPEWEKENGQEARKHLKLFDEHKPVRVEDYSL